MLNQGSVEPMIGMFSKTQPPLTDPKEQKPPSPDYFSKELNRLQEEQLLYMRKTEKEKVRSQELDNDLEQARKNLRAIQEKTKNGNIVKDIDAKNKKQIGRLEHQLQTAKIKLSVSKNENATLKKRVQDLRRDKLLNLQILNDLVKEASDARKRLKQCQREILSINEKKHKAKVGIVSLKHKMVRDLEEFSREITLAKQNISSTQENLLSTIKDRLEQSFTAQVHDIHGKNKQRGGGLEGDFFDDAKNQHFAHNHSELENVLQETECTSVVELMSKLQQSEEQMFILYNDTQEKHEEMEKIDLENKHLESQVEAQMTRLQVLEGHHDQVKQELEKSIQHFKRQIAKYEVDYQRNLEVLNSFSINLTNLLKNVAIDEQALDQQLLSTGITDRNVDDFLGLIEQRIDDLIQMSKAANNQAIRRDDFVKTVTISSQDRGTLTVPTLPSLNDGGDDDDDYVDETVKLQPINIHVLKDLMQKKMQKLTIRGNPGNNSNNNKPLGPFGHLDTSFLNQEMRSGQSSNVSVSGASDKSG